MSTIEDLKAIVSRKGGLARPNQFLVELPPDFFDTRVSNILCTNVQLPGKQILTHDRRINMEFEKVAYGYGVGDVNMTFLATNDHEVKKFFDRWKSSILDEESLTVGYKAEYQRPVKIHHLKKPIFGIQGRIGPVSISLNLGADSIYSLELKNAFPTTLGQIDLTNELDGIVQYNVQLSYTNWRRIDGIRQIGLDLSI